MINAQPQLPSSEAEMNLPPELVPTSAPMPPNYAHSTPVSHSRKPLILAVTAVVVASVAAGAVYYQYMARPKPDNTILKSEPSFPAMVGEIPKEVPSLPTYPGAELKGTVKVNEGKADEGYFIKWESHDSIPQIMSWYEAGLTKSGWTYRLDDDSNSPSEQVAQIENESFKGYMAAEVESVEGSVPEIEIVIDIRHKR